MVGAELRQPALRLGLGQARSRGMEAGEGLLGSEALDVHGIWKRRRLLPQHSAEERGRRVSVPHFILAGSLRTCRPSRLAINDVCFANLGRGSRQEADRMSFSRRDEAEPLEPADQDANIEAPLGQ